MDRYQSAAGLPGDDGFHRPGGHDPMQDLLQIWKAFEHLAIFRREDARIARVADDIDRIDRREHDRASLRESPEVSREPRDLRAQAGCIDSHWQTHRAVDADVSEHAALDIAIETG